VGSVLVLKLQPRALSSFLYHRRHKKGRTFGFNSGQNCSADVSEFGLEVVLQNIEPGRLSETGLKRNPFLLPSPHLFSPGQIYSGGSDLRLCRFMKNLL